MAKGYTAYVLDQESRQRLIDIFGPKYPETIAHHITHKFGATEDDVPEMPQSVRIVGFHDSGAMQVLVAEVDGERRQATTGEGERFYHITFSLDRAQGVEPKDSNAVLQKIAAEKGPDALRNLHDPVEITVKPQFILSGSSKNPQPPGKATGPRF